MKHDFKEHRGRSGLSHTELAQEARSWKIRGIAQLVLAAVTVMFLTLYKLRDSFFFLAVGLGCGYNGDPAAPQLPLSCMRP